MKRFLLYTIISVLVSLTVFPQTKAIKHHAFSGTLMIGVEAGATLGFTDYDKIKPEVLGRGVLEYFFPTTSAGILGIKAFFSGGYVAGSDDTRNPTAFRSTITRMGGGLSYTFSIQEAVFPFIFAGASYGWVNPMDNNKVDLPYAGRTFDIANENYHLEAGIRFLLSDAINLNINLGTEFSPNDNWDALPVSGGNDFLMHGLIGLSYSIFTEVDEDGDGVADSEDQCPLTPKGVLVDNFGCPLDADKDGVPDYLDKCPDTKSGMKVDEFGCVTDADADGVPDVQDKCPNTAKGAKVNEFGCPDSDGDGVFDNADKCPSTPKGAPVELDGCPKDSDKDGVFDYLDECPNTPAGEQVDEKGCSTQKDTVTVTIKEVVTLTGDTNFESGKANLLPAAYQILDPLVETMKQNPDKRWRIEGHTDAVGSDAYNMELSRKRAQSVVDYITSKGIERNRLEAVPLGESQPIASNDTQEGKAMNRRVEIKLIK